MTVIGIRVQEIEIWVVGKNVCCVCLRINLQSGSGLKFSLFLCVSVCLSVSFSFYLFLLLTSHLSTYESISFVHPSSPFFHRSNLHSQPSINPSQHPIHPSIPSTFVHPSIHPINRSIQPYIYPAISCIHPSIYCIHFPSTFLHSHLTPISDI